MARAENDPTLAIQGAAKEGETAMGSGAQSVKTACSVNAQTVETACGDDDIWAEIASRTAMADAKGSSIRRDVKEVPIAVGASAQARKTASSTAVNSEDLFQNGASRASCVMDPGVAGAMSARMQECVGSKEAEHRDLMRLYRHYRSVLFRFLRRMKGR